MGKDFDPDQIVRQVTENLQKKFPKKKKSHIQAEVQSAVDALKDRPIRDYIAVLAEREVKQQLKRE